MNSKAVRDFNMSGDVAAFADGWASSNNFDLKGVDPDGTRRYQRGHGLMVHAQHATVRQSGTQVHLEAWTHATMVDRIFSFGMMPANMTVESGGMRGWLPRKLAREAVNKFLEQLSQPPIP
jgi:hypothetical protein